MIIPLLSGEGGAAISRRNYGETIADLTNPKRFPYWFTPRYADYAFDVDSLPVDGHMLPALLTPRPVLLITGATDTWSNTLKLNRRVFGVSGLIPDSFFHTPGCRR